MSDELFKIDWIERLSGKTTEQAWDIFHEIYKYIVVQNSPLYMETPKVNRKWISARIKRTIKKKCKLWKVFKTTQRNIDYL